MPRPQYLHLPINEGSNGTNRTRAEQNMCWTLLDIPQPSSTSGPQPAEITLLVIFGTLMKVETCCGRCPKRRPGIAARPRCCKITYMLYQKPWTNGQLMTQCMLHVCPCRNLGLSTPRNSELSPWSWVYSERPNGNQASGSRQQHEGHMSENRMVQYYYVLLLRARWS